MLSKTSQCKNSAGFGLIELMVSMSIMAIVSTIVLVNQNSFNSAIVLRNQTYEVAFLLRQAQLVAVSGTDNRTSDGQRFGVQLHRANNTVIFFRDENANGRYDSADTIIEQRRLDRRFQIADMSIGGTAVPIMHVIFERPNFDALIYDASASRSGLAAVSVGSINTGVTRTIEITNSGNISVIGN